MKLSENDSDSGQSRLRFSTEGREGKLVKKETYDRGENGSVNRKTFRGADYSTRAVKIRLFAMVCGVMLVLLLMFEARKPENWSWMGFTKSKEANIDTRWLANLYNQQSSFSKTIVDTPGNLDVGDQASGQEKDEPVNLTVQDLEATGTFGNNEANTKAIFSSSEDLTNQDQVAPLESNETDSPKDSEDSQLDLAEKDYWETNYRKLNFRQRMLMLEGLYRSRNGKKLAEEQASEWLRMIEELTVANERYQADILQYLNSLPENSPQRGGLSETLFRLQERWKKSDRVLKLVGNRGDLSAADHEVLIQFQAVLDQTMIDFVEDNSLQSFANDQPAMFRLIEKLQQEGPCPAGQVAEEVVFSQLYKETDRLRGKPVTFYGTIRGGYSARPTPNYLDVNRLYVYWIQIKGAMNPVAVYSLKQPKDFVINLEDYSAREPAELRESVRITGVLLQKMVYAAEDGQRIAPVIFTDNVDWTPQEKRDSANNELPGLTPLVGSFLALGGGFAVFTWFFVAFNNRRHAQRLVELKNRMDNSEN